MCWPRINVPGPLLPASIRRLVTLHSPVFLLNSRYSHFIATSLCFIREGLHTGRHTFSRSYGVKLPSSLTRFNSIVLGYSPHPPESVYGTITATARYETFLGSMESATSGVNSSHSPLEVNVPRIYQRHLLQTYTDIQLPAGVSFSVLPYQ